MNTRKQIALLLPFIAGLIYFIAVLYHVGCKVDVLSWNNTIRVYSLIAVLGGILSAAMLIIAVIKANMFRLRIGGMVALIILVLLSFLFLPNWKAYEKQSAKIPDSYFTNYTFDDVLEKRGIQDKRYMLYVGRADCSDCKKFKPILEKVGKNEDVFIAYYNTGSDRKKEDFEQKMNMLKIKEIPAVRIIGCNETIVADKSIYKSEDVLRKYIREVKEKYDLPNSQ